MFQLTIRMICLATALLVLWSPAYAQTVFTQDAYISATDVQYEHQDIIVSGATLIVDGYHEFRSLRLENGAVLNHSVAAEDKLNLSISNSVFIDSQSSINLDGHGNRTTSNVRNVGGSHGGRGGGSDPVPEYGSYKEPTEYGVGAYVPSRGGGAIRLSASNLYLEGVISANGQMGLSNSYSGGSSGGSIWITVGLLSGHGSIRANGGPGHSSNSYNSGGGGGRVAIYYGDNAGFDLSNVVALGGSGNSNGQDGGAGTVYFEDLEQGSRILKFKSTVADSARTQFSDLLGENAEIWVNDANIQLTNIGLADFNTKLRVHDGHLVISPSPSEDQRWRWHSATLDNSGLTLNGAHQFMSVTAKNNSVISHSADSVVKLDLKVLDHFLIDESSSIDVTGRGMRAAVNTYDSGASYGGRGGVYHSSYPTNPEYGDYLRPTDYGTSLNTRVRGGGAIKLAAASLQLDGSIKANGGDGSGTGGSSYSGAGSGGSIWLDVGTLSGNGSVQAHGGDGNGSADACGGGGGRIAVYYEQNAGFDLAKVYAMGGDGQSNGQRGGPGTVYYGDKTQTNRVLKFQSTSANSARTKFDGSESDNLELVLIHANVQLHRSNTDDRWKWRDAVLHGADLTLDGASEFKNLTVKNGSIVRHTEAADEKLDILVSGAAIIDETSFIDVSARGTYGEVTTTASGGSYGGRGGVYSNRATNSEYGDVYEPQEHGTSRSRSVRGGGAIKLTADTLLLNGRINADGGEGVSSFGGGSGGSVWLDVGTLSGSGSIHADGGAGAGSSSQNSGGGGGRVALYIEENDDFDFDNVSATGGIGNRDGQDGGAGTVFYAERAQESQVLRFKSTQRGSAQTRFTATGTEDIKLVVDQANVKLNHAQGVERWVWNDVVVSEGLLTLDGSHEFHSLRLLSNGYLTHPAGAEKKLTVVTGEVVIDPTSAIDLNGKGEAIAGRSVDYAGGSYGGIGGTPAPNYPSNPVYGDYRQPVDYGTSVNSSTRGGGSIKLSAHSLRLDGSIKANGSEGNRSDGQIFWNAGGGSGGSVWLDIVSLSGIGSIQANGGAGGINNTLNSGGGGGRIAVYVEASNLNLSNIAAEGGFGRSAGKPGSPGTVHLDVQVINTAITRVSLSPYMRFSRNSFTVDFINDVDSSTFSVDDVELLYEGQSSIEAVSIDAVASNRFQVNYAQMLPEGEYRLRIGPYISSFSGGGMDQDGDGITGEVEDDVFEFSFTIDTTAPNPPMLDQPKTIFLSSPSLTLSGSRDDETAVYIRYHPWVPVGSGDWSVDYTWDLYEGRNDLWMYAQDRAGNQSEGINIVVYLDTTPPYVIAFSPTGVRRHPPSTIRALVVEDGTWLDDGSYMIVKRNGIRVAGEISEDEQPFVFIPDSPLLEGDYTVDVVAVDRVGNSNAQSFDFTLDYTPPKDLSLDPHPSVVVAQTITLSGSKEVGSSVLLDGQLIVPLNDQDYWSYLFTLEEGNNHFELSSQDLAGNTSGITRASITYDNTVPGPVAFTVSAEGDGKTVILDWSDYDEVANGNDIERYLVLASQNDFSDPSAPGVSVLGSTAAGEKTFTATDLSRGQTVYFAVVAEDHVGQKVESVTAVAVQPIDVVPPEEIGELTASSGANHIHLEWLPSPNTAGDLQGYRVYIGDAEPDTREILLTSLEDPAAPVSYTLLDLQGASSYPIRVTAFDNDGNETEGRHYAGATWLPNPTGLTGEALSGRVELSWNPVVPHDLLKHYAIYVEASDFSDVSDRTPVVTAAKGSAGASSVSRAVAGLTNGTTYYIAVTSVNIADGELPAVSTIALTPSEDVSGPEITAVNYNNAGDILDLRQSPIITRSGDIIVNANDVSGLSRAELRLNGTLLGSSMPGADGSFSVSVDLADIADGTHSLNINVYDSLDNLTTEILAIEVALAPPGAPQLTGPADGLLTNQETVNVTGRAALASQVQLYINGEPQGDAVLVNSQGEFSSVATLVEGENKLTAAAAYPDRGGFGESSAVRTVTLDSAVPSAPAGFSAVSGQQGQVFLQWNKVESGQSGNTIVGYRLYRSTEPFNSISDPGVTEASASLITNTSYTDLLLVDGDYVYRVAAENHAGTVGELSALQSVVADGQGPRALKVSYDPIGNVDPVSGAIAPGLVSVTVDFNESLRNKPYFAIVPNGGLPIAIDLTKDYSIDTRYRGSFNIEPGTMSGTAYAVLAAYDKANNRGTEIDEGATLIIDTDGPDVSSISLNPGEPLKVDPNTGLTVEVFLRLTDEVKAGESPVLTPTVDGIPVPAYLEGVALHRDAQSEPGNPLWVGSFLLPNTVGLDDHGEPTAAVLGFNYIAHDDLDNAGQPVTRQFQIYQGDLPPLAVPLGLTAQAASNGRVELEWRAVEGAAAYQLYRQAPGEMELSEYRRLTETSFADQTTADGNYFYTVASVREENGEVALSAQSDLVTVSADRIAPAAPANLTLELNGAGIVARWEPPKQDAEGAPENTSRLTYNLYRTNLTDGQQVDDISGYTPIQQGIPEPIALDTQPSESEHSYFVTAVDAAGNESRPSETVYLNFGLLPVQRLSVELLESSLPQLSWRHSGVGITGYNVYRGADDALTLITQSPIPHTGTTTYFIDESYNSGAGTDGAHVERRYTVAAVDEHGMESIGHTLTLPALSVSLASAKGVAEDDPNKLLRGVMNELLFRVENKGSESQSGLRLNVSVKAGSDTYTHQSEVSSVEAGSFAVVPVVVGGYQNLDGLVDLVLRLEREPVPGDKVAIQQSQAVSTGDNALVVTLSTETFTRGGQGTAVFSVENTSAVETEIVMATNNGNRPSNEARLILEDLDGNVLAVQAVQQFTGDVISIGTGASLARIPSGGTFTSEPITMTVPTAAPDNVRVRLEIDKFHYQLGRPTHVAIEGTGTRREVGLRETAYYGVVTSISPEVIYTDSEEVTINGQALERNSGSSLANVPLKVIVAVRGFERSFNVMTDDEGSFSLAYMPQNESGLYTVSVIHPDMEARPNHGQFSIQTGSVSPATASLTIPRNYTQRIPIRVQAGHDTTLEQVRLVPQPPPGETEVEQTVGLTLTHEPIAKINPRSSAYINLHLAGDNTAPASGRLYYRVEAQGFTGDKALGNVVVSYQLSEARPALTASPSYVETGVGIDGVITETFKLTNKGLETLINPQLSIRENDGSAAPSWVSLLSNQNLADLPVGQSTQVQVQVAPHAGVSEGNYHFIVTLQGDNHGEFTVPFFVAVTQSGRGNMFFHVSDIYTATFDDDNKLIPGLSGAKIKLQNELVLSETFELSTDANGEATFVDLPAGRYTYRVSAFDHSSVSGRVFVKPGITGAEEVFLMNQVVSVEWQVNEITIEDRYEIKLEATFKTNVPVAVVMLNPLNVRLPVMRKGDVFYGELTLTNYGLIRADNVQASLPSGNNLARFEFLREIPETLEAGQVFTLPYRVLALADFNPDADGSATGGACGSFNAQMRVDYVSQCANGTVVPGGTSTNWNANWDSNSCGGGGTGGSGAGGGSSSFYYGGRGGSGSAYTPSGTSIGGGEASCRADDYCEACNADNSSGW